MKEKRILIPVLTNIDYSIDRIILKYRGIGGYTYMKVSKRKRSSIIIPTVIAVRFYAAAIWALAYGANQGIKNYAAYCALVPLSSCVPVLLMAMIIAAAKSYLVFGSDYFEYHAVGKSILIAVQNMM